MAYQNVTPDSGKYSTVLNCWGDQNYEHLAPPLEKCTEGERDKMAFGKGGVGGGGVFMVSYISVMTKQKN